VTCSPSRALGRTSGTAHQLRPSPLVTKSLGVHSGLALRSSPKAISLLFRLSTTSESLPATLLLPILFVSIAGLWTPVQATYSAPSARRRSGPGSKRLRLSHIPRHFPECPPPGRTLTMSVHEWLAPCRVYPRVFTTIWSCRNRESNTSCFARGAKKAALCPLSHCIFPLLEYLCWKQGCTPNFRRFPTTGTCSGHALRTCVCFRTSRTSRTCFGLLCFRLRCCRIGSAHSRSRSHGYPIIARTRSTELRRSSAASPYVLPIASSCSADSGLTQPPAAAYASRMTHAVSSSMYLNAPGLASCSSVRPLGHWDR
jgi:hypothetical protein